MSFRHLPRHVVAALLLAGCGERAPAAQPTGSGADPAIAADAIEAPPGFTVEVFHPGIGNAARHVVVRDNGDVLVARQEGVLVGLRDADGDGRAEQMEERQLAITTGLALHGDFLHYSDDVSVSRLRLDDALVPQGEPELVVGDFMRQGSHRATSP